MEKWLSARKDGKWTTQQWDMKKQPSVSQF